MSHSEDTSLYPEPALIVGVGRFGLRVVERLGADWRWLAASSGGDPSLKNLRLVSVRSESRVDDERWIRTERDVARVARATGEDDLPTLAVHFAIVRAMGLVRYRNGTYQFAVPRDAGVVEIGDEHRTRRRRFFDWHPLDSDPLRAVERLHRLADDKPEVDLFLTPIVERVFHGQSPQLLLHLIGRCRALMEGRDPSPWPWIRRELPLADAGDERFEAVVEPEQQWLTDDDRAGFLDGLIPPPLTRWPNVGDDERDRGDSTSLDAGGPMRVPRPFWPAEGDLATPLSPRRFLRVDWERSGWVTGELDPSHSVEFTPVDASLYRLGFFDHDTTGGVDSTPLSGALKSLGEQVHRGLLRIWLDLRHEREETGSAKGSTRQRAGADRAVEQCLEVLGQLVVEPVVKADDELVDRPEMRDDRWVDGPPLPKRPSNRLVETVVDTETLDSMPERPLLERLSKLGIHFDTEELGQRSLLRDLTVEPADLDDDARLTPFRRILNEETRHLVSFDHLKEYRQRPTHKPPRLSIYVVADMREPFARRVLQPVLRALHQEMMRGYGPLFDTSQQGFDRPLSIVPVVWTPHPADAFGGDFPEANRIEEASILDAVHGLRRWVEALPDSRQCVPQIFINSRVTDNSVLGLDDAARQTRDFVSLQIRNDLTKDPWLRKTAVGFESDDLFSTFSCVQTGFPAERAREYLANRLARQALARLRTAGRGDDAGDREFDVESLAPPPEDLLEPSKRKLRELTADTARRISGRVEDRIVVDEATTSVEILEAMDEQFEELLFDRIHDAWLELSRNRGAMDDMVDQLRSSAADYLLETLEDQRRQADRLVDAKASEGGLATVRSEFRRLRDRTRSVLEESERDRRRHQEICLDHDLPDPTPIEGARQRVERAGEDKPDALPLKMGLVFWAIMAPVLGAPLAHATARAFDLHEATNPVEWILGPAGWIVGGIVVFLPVYFLLRRHLRRATNEVRDAISDLASTVRDVVEGPQHGVFDGPPSIRSFFAARLRLTAALADRNYAERVHDRVIRDNQLAVRLVQSVDVQYRRLRKRAEALGVRPTSLDEPSDPIDDDVAGIFGGDDGRATGSLLSPTRLVDYYRRHIPDECDVDRLLPELLERAGGFDRWRKQACLSDTEALMETGRHEFAEIVTVPIGAHPLFENEVGDNLVEFVARHYPNLGFGAQFVGYEGFDSSGMRRMADTALVLHPMLRTAFEKARERPESKLTTETLDVVETGILPNTAFMLSLVQGINSRSIDNLRRHETFYDRLQLPDPAVPWRDRPLTLVGRPAALPQRLESEPAESKDEKQSSPPSSVGASADDESGGELPSGISGPETESPGDGGQTDDGSSGEDDQ